MLVTQCLKIAKKSLILKNCERSEVRWKCPSFVYKPESCSQKVLPEGSLLIGEKLVENAKIQKFKSDILSNFQTMWDGS